MQIGVVLPQTEIGTDVGSVRDYAQAAQDLGFEHLVTSDHVLGANPAGHPGWTRPQHHTTVVHEPFVLFGFIAGVAPKLGLLTSVVILPQRQTALVAKQAAEVDVLSGGKLRLGVGIGWNPVEFEGLGMNFKDRARRFEEQVDLMRKLWTDESISLQRDLPHRDIGRDLAAADPAADPDLGRRHRRGSRQAGHADRRWLPAARAGRRDQQLRRDDGQGPAAGSARRAAIRRRSASRRGSTPPTGTPDDWRKTVDDWRRLGATHLSVGTSGAGLSGVDAHIKRLREVQPVLSA